MVYNDKEDLMTYIAVNRAASMMFIEDLDLNKAWSSFNKNGWTFQSVFGNHCEVIFASESRKKAEEQAEEFLRNEFKGFQVFGIEI